MTTPRTVSGRAAISAMRPYVKRALGRTIADIENEAAAPFRDALAEADGVLAELIEAHLLAADLVARARVAHRRARQVLDEAGADEPG